jgi:hypothetical protein
MASLKNEKETRLVLMAGLLLHIGFFGYDVATGFEPMLRGDRSSSRLHALLAFNVNDALSVLVSNPVIPGEYFAEWVAYGLGGQTGIVIFQIALFLASVWALCKTVSALFPEKSYTAVVGLVYLALPQNLVFTHQLVTEAIVTPLLVFFAYFYIMYFKYEQTRQLLMCGLTLGLAIVVRPVFAIVPPTLVLSHLVYRRYLCRRAALMVALICGLSILPIAGWVATYTIETGKLGFTSGVANLGWNLRSKVWWVYTRNQLEKPAEIKAYSRYSDLYQDSDGISVGRFLQLAAEHPILFARPAIIDVLTLFRGNSSKLIVDYFGISRDQGVKGWRDILSEEGIAGELTLLMQSKGTFLSVGTEFLFSVITAPFIATAILFAIFCLARPKPVSGELGTISYGMILVQSAILFTVFVSSQIVDQAQPRLRHPAEAGLILLLAFLWRYRTARKLQPEAGSGSARKTEAAPRLRQMSSTTAAST